MKSHSPIHEFIHQLLLAWKAKGYTVGIDTHLRMQQLANAIPKNTSNQKLKTLFTPLLAGNQQQQQELYHLIDTLFESLPKQRPIWENIIVFLLWVALLGTCTLFLFQKYLDSSPQIIVLSENFYTQVEIGKTTNISLKESTRVFFSINRVDSVLAKHAQISFPNPVSLDSCQIRGISIGTDSILLTYDLKIPNSRSKGFLAKDVTTENHVYLIVEVIPVRSTIIDTVFQDTYNLAFKKYDHQRQLSSLELEKYPPFGIEVADWNWGKTAIFMGFILLLIQLSFLSSVISPKKQINAAPNAKPMRRKPNSAPPYMLQLSVPESSSIGFGDTLAGTVHRLNQRLTLEQQVFDVRGTIRRTIQQAGRISLGYISPSEPKEYLWLIDTTSPHDHRAQLFEELYHALTQNEVLIERFFFHRDPRLCWNDKYPDGIRLPELQHRFGNHHLLIFSDGDALLSPFNGELQEWTRVFKGWKLRSFLSIRYFEWLKAEEFQFSTKFQVVPASLQGIKAVLEYNVTELPNLPLNLNTVNNSLYLPDTLSTEAFITALEAEFVEYYPHRIDERWLKWIAACAVSPILHWDTTLFFGKLVDDFPQEPLMKYENIEKLFRLGWYTSKGLMPENARKALLSWLEEKHYELLIKIRIEWKRILEYNLFMLQQNANAIGESPFENSVAYDELRLLMIVNELAIDNLQDKKMAQDERHQLEQELQERSEFSDCDFFALQLLNEAQEEVIQKEDHQADQKNSTSLFFARPGNWIWQLCISAIAFFSIWCFNPGQEAICLGESVEYMGKKYCLYRPEDSLTYFEHVICDSMKFNPLRINYKNNEYPPSIIRLMTQVIAFKADGIFKQADSINQIIEIEKRLVDNYIFQSKFLIARYDLDSSSFYRNVGKAYWNTGVYHYNAGRIDSACVYFSKLEKWSWRDSVVTKRERDLMAKICNLRPDGQPTNPESERDGVTNNNSPNRSEGAEWSKAIATDNAEAYALYLERFPNGANATEARKRLADLVSRSELNAWDRAKLQDNVASYESYLKAYPNGVYAAMARQRINDLLDNAAWSEAQKTNTPAACRRYLNEFPNGLYREEALKCVNPPRADINGIGDSTDNIVTYLFNDERLGVNVMERLLSKIEALSKVKQSADREINEWRTKNRILDSLVISREAEISRLNDDLGTGGLNKEKILKKIAGLDEQLAKEYQSLQTLQDRFNRAMIENVRIQDSLRREISFRDGLLFKMAEEDFWNGIRVVLMKTNKRGQLSPINPSSPTKADKADIDAMVLYYDFSVSESLQFPLASKIEVKIPSLNYYKVFNVKSLKKSSFYQYKGKIVIETGNSALNINKMGTIYLNVRIFEGDQTIETKPNSLKIYVNKL